MGKEENIFKAPVRMFGPFDFANKMVYLFVVADIAMVFRLVYRYGCLKFIFIAKAVTCAIYTHWKRDGRLKGGGGWYITELMDLLGCFAICASICVLCVQSMLVEIDTKERKL